MVKKLKTSKNGAPSQMLKEKPYESASKMLLLNKNDNTCSLDFSGSFGNPTVSTRKISTKVVQKVTAAGSLRFQIPDAPTKHEILLH